MGQHLLSKSSFIKGIQCEKQLYLYKYHYDWMDEISSSQKAVFKRGTDVGILAQGLFPNGVKGTQDPKKSDEAINRTHDLIEKGTKVIYEAAFELLKTRSRLMSDEPCLCGKFFSDWR